MPGRLTLRAGPAQGCHVASLPQTASGQWCRLEVGLAGSRRWWVKVEIEDADRGQVVREAFLGAVRRRVDRGWRGTLLHVPHAAGTLTIRLFAEDPTAMPDPVAELRVLTRPAAALALLAGGWRLLPRALAGGRMGLTGRLRAMLGQAPARAGEAPGYDVWLRLYDRWGTEARAALVDRVQGGPRIEIVVVGDDPALRAATLASIDAQWVPPARTVMVDRPAAWRGGEAGWVLLVQAGEVLAAHAVACFSHDAARHPSADGFYADVDVIADGGRRDPLFKPCADPWLLGSGLLTRGACLFRAGLPDLASGADPDAESWRQRLAVALRPDTFQGIPFILTGVPVLAPGTPEIVPPPATCPFVTMVIPTAGRSAHMMRCLQAILDGTVYEGGFEVLLAVSRIESGDRVQTTNLARAGLLPHVRVLDLGIETFNYAAVNNRAAHHARGEFLLLLNDDVVPIRPDWLHRMVAFLAPRSGLHADVVGARLLYGNGSVQHGGVVMGLANLCEHAFRLSPRDDRGPHGIAALDREVSAVTAACMLVRRSRYESIGGMDESFAIALNDVDFCLRARQAGARIVFAAGVELYHYESLSLGRHYAGARSVLEAKEVRRLRDRWPGAIAADPFYSPSASLEPGREFQPGFASRTTPLGWISGERPAGS